MITSLSHAADGFSAIFNGENFEGWHIRLRKDDEPELKKKVFAAEDGIIHVFKGVPAGFDANAKPDDRRTCGVLFTDRSYTNYIFRFQYKWGNKSVNCPQELNLNSGCFYHVTHETVWPKSIEFQLKYDHKGNRDNTGAVLRGGNTFTWYAADDQSNTFLSPAEGGRAITNRLKGGWLPRPIETIPEAALDWNQCEIIVMADRFAIHKLNGEIVNLITDISSSAGGIGLQAEYAEIFFRDLEIKEFEEPMPLEHFVEL